MVKEKRQLFLSPLDKSFVMCLFLPLSDNVRFVDASYIVFSFFIFNLFSSNIVKYFFISPCSARFSNVLQQRLHIIFCFVGFEIDAPIYPDKVFISVCYLLVYEVAVV